MKKLLLASALCLTTLTAAAQSITVNADVPRVIQSSDGTFTVDFEILDSKFDIRGFQFEIDTPSGILEQSTAVNEDNVENYTLQTAKKPLTGSDYGEYYKTIVNSSNEGPLTVEDNKGKIISITFKVNPKRVTYGNSNFQFKSIRFTKADENGVLTTVKARDFVKPISVVTLLGDTDLSGKVTADDVTELGNIIVNKSDRSFSAEGNIDYSDDVNSVSDIVRLIELLKNQ